MRGFICRDYAVGLPVEVNARSALSTAGVVGNAGCVDSEREFDELCGDFRHGGNQISMNADLERRPNCFVQSRDCVWKALARRQQYGDCGFVAEPALVGRLRGCGCRAKRLNALASVDLLSGSAIIGMAGARAI